MSYAGVNVTTETAFGRLNRSGYLGYERRPIVASRARSPGQPGPATPAVSTQVKPPPVLTNKARTPLQRSILTTTIQSQSKISDILAPTRKAAPNVAPRLRFATAAPKQPLALRRQTPSPALRILKETQKSSSKPKVKSHKKTPLLLTSMAVVVFGVGLAVSLNGWRTDKTVKAQVAHLTQSSDQGTSSQASSDIPDESHPPAAASLGSYQVAADLPRFLRIPKLQVNARVKRLGVKSDNELQTPSTIYDTGWYDGSSKPGEGGAVLIDGHVSGPTKQGVFYGLKTLQPGDKIDLERGDGVVFHYQVVKSQAYDDTKVDMVAALTPVTPGKNGLNLITCTGKFDPASNEFKQREIVFAVQE